MGERIDLSSLSKDELLNRITKGADAGGRKDLKGSDYADFAWAKAQEYGEAMDVDPIEVLRGFETRRSYWAVNYYQDANFPSLENVRIFETQAEMKELVSKGFRCPFCEGISKHPYKCDTGIKVGKGKQKHVCDWKAYGLLGTLGKGLTFTVREGFAEHATIDHCFYPVAFETSEVTN